jgi:hypothetical protein
MTLNEIIELASEHAERLASDVKSASTRLEHVRVTARAQEAVNLLHYLNLMSSTGESDGKQDGDTGTVRLDG